jgi:abortive phage resistance protein AbiGi (putative antitoxin)
MATFSQGRPDLSEYLVHFTKGTPPLGPADAQSQEVKAVAEASARSRIESILVTKTIYASHIPWANSLAVCLTECPWPSLIGHSENYSPYGIGFSKSHIFAAGGNPVFYIRDDLYKKQRTDPFSWHSHVHTFITPFTPPYAGKAHVDSTGHGIVDYSHEREWRVPHNFTFELSQVKFVIVDSYEDVATFPKVLKDAIGRDRFLIMDVYRQIEKFWPVHITT